MKTANYTDLRANLKGYIDSVIDDYDTVIVNRGNGKGVVMISLDEYNSLKETEYIMSSPETMNSCIRVFYQLRRIFLMRLAILGLFFFQYSHCSIARGVNIIFIIHPSLSLSPCRS